MKNLEPFKIERVKRSQGYRSKNPSAATSVSSAVFSHRDLRESTADVTTQTSRGLCGNGWVLPAGLVAWSICGARIVR